MLENQSTRHFPIRSECTILTLIVIFARRGLCFVYNQALQTAVRAMPMPQFPLAYVPLLGPGSRLSSDQQELLAALQRAEREQSSRLSPNTLLDPERRRRVELTLGEMLAQPRAIKETLDAEAEAIRNTGRAIAARHMRRIYLVGCGDSLAAGYAVRPLFERLLGVSCEALEALEYAHYLYSNTDGLTVVLAISSSGATVRTLEALLRARSMGALTVGISNTRDAPMLGLADHGLLVHAERRGWPTQATTAAMTVLCQLGLQTARAQGSDTRELEREMARVPALIETALAEFSGPMAELAERLSARPVYLFSGGGPSWATAQLGAAKVRECTPLHAFAIQVEEFHHYVSQKPGDPLFLIAPEGPSSWRVTDAAKAGKAWGGFVCVLTGSVSSSFEECADLELKLPAIIEDLSPLIFVVPLQLFAYHLARFLFAKAEQRVK